jgi:hypothetical protein
MMLMVPKAVGAKALLINKKPALLYMRDLCHPVYRYTQ